MKGARDDREAIGDGAVIDKSFNTVDVCVMVMTGELSASYARRYRDAV